MQEQGKSAFGLDPNVAAGLAYIPVCLCHLVVSIAILATDKTNKLSRFHAVQSLLLSASILAGYIVCIIAVFVIVILAAAANAPALSFLAFFAYLIFIVYALAGVVGLIISCIKAFQGEIFKLPIIGNMADKWSN
ncbi:MAG: DUF4870 domain-containing protein [Acidobacteria bacterium]|nr:DUF4870 domain-containing protein [Acidobacteriota bacterium]